MSDYCMLFSQTFYGLLFSYLTITDVTSYVDHTVHLTESFLQTVLQMLLSQKNNSCTLCVPMCPTVSHFPLGPLCDVFLVRPIFPGLTHYSLCYSFFKVSLIISKYERKVTILEHPHTLQLTHNFISN